MVTVTFQVLLTTEMSVVWPEQALLLHAMVNKCPYHGKAAPAGATCSDVAKSLNWPEDVWDLSGEMPKLK